MAEKVLSLPLSGEEIIESVVDRIRTRLQKDGFLNPALAYDYYEGSVSIKLKSHDCGRVAETNIEETVTGGEIPEGDNPDQYLDQSESEFEIAAQPPNEVRVETGQPVPVATSDGKIKKVKYARNKAKKAS